MPRRLTIEDAHKEAEKHGGWCLSHDYVNSRTKLSWQCEKCNFIWQSNLSVIKNNNAWCPKCAKNAKHTLDDCRDLAVQRDGLCLSSTYINSVVKLEWKCAKGHVFWMDYAHVFGENQWCSECGKYHTNLKSSRHIDGVKFCAGCGLTKPLDDFNNSKRFNDGKRFYCRSCEKEKHQVYLLKDIEKIKTNRRNSRQRRKDKTALQIKNRTANDPVFKLSRILRSRIGKVIEGNAHSGVAIRDLGCTGEFLKKYLEDKFYSHPETGELMTWSNHSLNGWHIDHIKPLCLFNLTDQEQLKQACHYTNLQPLWAKENLKKSGKY